MAGRRFLCATPRLRYTPVIQEIFATESGDLRQVLRDKINACEVSLRLAKPFLVRLLFTKMLKQQIVSPWSLRRSCRAARRR